MSSPKTYKRYASAWYLLFDKLKTSPHEEHVIECPTPERAKAVRSEFYKARAAFLREEGMAKEFGETLNSREVLVRDNKVVFAFKDENWVAKLILDSLGEEEQK